MARMTTLQSQTTHYPGGVHGYVSVVGPNTKVLLLFSPPEWIHNKMNKVHVHIITRKLHHSQYTTHHESYILCLLKSLFAGHANATILFPHLTQIAFTLSQSCQTTSISLIVWFASWNMCMDLVAQQHGSLRGQSKAISTLQTNMMSGKLWSDYPHPASETSWHW